MHRSLVAKLAGLLVALTVGTGVAHAQLAGPRLLQAFGGAVDTTAPVAREDGHMALAGSMNLTSTGGATAINATVVYQDSAYDADGFVCPFTQPGDVSYSFPNGLDAAGTLTLTVSANDPDCFQMSTGIPGSEAGNSVTFAIYASNGSASLVGVSTTFKDSDNDTILSPVAVSGTLTKTDEDLGNVLSGRRLFNALGGTTDKVGDSGHIALGGLAKLDAKGVVKTLDVTLSYVDSVSGGFACELTTPTDLSYSLSKGVGTLTLTVSATDTSCTPAVIGSSITFNLYSAGMGTPARIIATSSSLKDSTSRLRKNGRFSLDYIVG